MANPRQAFPTPPPFYKLFGDAGKGRKRRFDELEPPVPVEGDYQVFGEIFEASDGIPKIAVQQLFSDREIDFKTELRKLNREAMFCYKKLIDTVVLNPGGYARDLENLGIILRNMHHLLNLMRLKQAPLSLEHMLMMSVESKKQSLVDVQRHKCEAKLALKSASEALKAIANFAGDCKQGGH